MSELPHPRLIAWSIAELATEQVRKAWRYLEATRALEACGMPRADVRRCLDHEPRETESTRAIAAWDKRGMRLIHGPVGTGKTYAGSRWALERHQAGRSTHWLAACEMPHGLDDVGAWLDKGERASTLVIDDAGAGSTYRSWPEEKFQAMLQTRWSRSRPTLILSNMNELEAGKWIGARLVDRLKVDGCMVAIEASVSLRQPEPDVLDDDGRGDQWRVAHELVTLVGCHRDYVIEAGKTKAQLEVGRTLAGTARGGGWSAVKRASKLLGLDRDEVIAQAVRLRDRRTEQAGKALDQRMKIVMARAAERSASLLAAKNYRAPPTPTEDMIRQRLAAKGEDFDLLSIEQQRALLAGCRKTRDEREILAEPSAPPKLAARGPKWATPGKLRELGWEVKTVFGGYDVRYRDNSMLYEPVATREDGWDAAARLCAGPEDTQP